MPLNLELPTTDGKAHSTKEHRGKVVLIVYETATGGALNKAAKDTLAKRAEQDSSLGDKFAIIPIANLSAIPAIGPIQSIAMGEVAKEAKKMGLPIWLDWSGAVGKALKLSGDSSFVILDKDGNISRDWIGKLGPHDIVDLIATLQTLHNA